MRTLPTILLGALTLSIGLLPTAAFAEDAPATEVSATASPAPTATVTPEPTVEPTATATATTAPTASATPQPTESADPDPDYLTGTFTSTPASGKPGTTVTFTSKTSCVDADGKVGNQVEVVGLTEADLTEDGRPSIDKFVKTDAAGAWTTTAKIPASAKTGDVYYLVAACFQTGLTIGEDTEPFLVYDFAEFTVTGADKAPIADPVPGDPNFTG